MGTYVSPLQSAEGPKDVNKVMARFGLSLPSSLVRYHPLRSPPLSTSELLDEQPERRRLTVVFVCDPLREFFGTTAYSLGVAVALPMLKGVPPYAPIALHGPRLL